MKKWKPLIASLLTIALAMGGLALWRYAGVPKSAAAGNAGPPDNASGNVAANTPEDTDPNGFKYETVPMQDLPELDPLALWPRDGQRIASVKFWVMWQTTGFSKCRLLGTSDGKNWVDLGSTGGEDHYLLMDLGYFGSKATFAVEFDSGGKRYRSKPRTVSFGQGVHFTKRTSHFQVGGKNQWALDLFGNASGLTEDSFLWLFAPQGLVPFVLRPTSHDGGGSVSIGVQNPDVLDGKPATIFLQVYDAQYDTYDRTMVELAP